MNCTSHAFCGRDIRLLEETGADETFPNFNHALQERTAGTNSKNWPQRNFNLKQKLLLEGKVRAKESEFEGAVAVIPTK